LGGDKLNDYIDQDYLTKIAQARQQAARYGQQAAYQSPEGQMVSGRFIAPHPFQYLANALRAAGGMAGESMELKRAAEFEDQLRKTQAQKKQATTDALRRFGELAQGTPENVAADGMGPVRPAQEGNMSTAYAQLMQSGNPELMKLGLQGAESERQRQNQFQLRKLELDRQERDRQATDLLIRDAEGNLVPNKLLIDIRRQEKESTAQPYYTPLQTTQGIHRFDARTGQITPLMGGNNMPLQAPQFDPNLQGRLSREKEIGKIFGEDLAGKIVNAPKLLDNATESLKLIDDLIAHPAKQYSVGVLGPVPSIPGTPQYDFVERLEQLEGSNFLQAFETLKGGGAITQVEGVKATAAIARLKRGKKLEDFDKALTELRDIYLKAQTKAELYQSLSEQPTTQQTGGGPLQQGINVPNANIQAPAPTVRNPILPPGVTPQSLQQKPETLEDRLKRHAP